MVYVSFPNYRWPVLFIMGLVYTTFGDTFIHGKDVEMRMYVKTYICNT